MPHVLIVGGGMAGLGAALAVSRQRPDWRFTVLEQAPALSEVGAGIQLGPNAVRVLHEWGLEAALRQCAVYPQAVQVRDVSSGRLLGELPLGERALARYGAPYATIHRADLHQLLWQALQDTDKVELCLGQRVEALQLEAAGPGVELHTHGGGCWQGDAVLACDGVWSRLREMLCNDGPARFTGDVAYRGMVPMADVPAPLRASRVSAWLGPRCHVVHYPVCAGAWMNVVAVVRGDLPIEGAHWDHLAHASTLLAALGGVAPALRDVLERVPSWRLWPLFARPALRSAQEQARGPVAFLGDAAHPMRPYMAQGAAMALEDAWALGHSLPQQAALPPDWSAWLLTWAQQRWQRNAWVQERSRRNGWIFHLDGPLRWGRNAAMALLGERLLDVPPLYSGPPAVHPVSGT